MSEEENLPVVARSSMGVDEPSDWDVAVHAAYLRIMGASQEDCAAGAGISRRTVQNWEASSWWPDAVAEACDRWLKNVTANSRAALLKAVENGDLVTARWIAERTIPELHPKAEISGPGGGPVPVSLEVHLVKPDDDDAGD